MSVVNVKQYMKEFVPKKEQRKSEQKFLIVSDSTPRKVDKQDKMRYSMHPRWEIRELGEL